MRTGASPEAIMSHYDMGEDFFKLVLDPELIYSCALFQDGDTLEQAQTRKLDHHIEAAAATGARRVLDIGCGWGAMLRRLSDHGQCRKLHGTDAEPVTSKMDSRPAASRP